MTLHIGPLAVDPPVVLAPMAGVTNAPFRRLCRSFGAGLYVCEMIAARAVVEDNAKTWRMAAFAPDESPRSLQLYAVDPHVAADAVRRVIGDAGVEHVDLNFGCPAGKVTAKGGGAALPIRHRLLQRIVRGAVEAAGPVPVTVKFRLGVDDDHLTHLATGRIAAGEGAAAVALHARTAEQLYSGAARWSAIGELRAHVDPATPVLGNGDILEAADALEMVRQTGCDGVVIGRGCLGKPWLFADLAAAFEGRHVPDPPRLGAVVDTMRHHARLNVEWFGETEGIRDFRKHTGWYVKGYPTGHEVRRRLHLIDTLAELDELVASLDRNATLPVENRRLFRAHTNGPRPVRLPPGWLDDPDNPASPAGADLVVSGG